MGNRKRPLFPPCPPTLPSLLHTRIKKSTCTNYSKKNASQSDIIYSLLIVKPLCKIVLYSQRRPFSPCSSFPPPSLPEYSDPTQLPSTPLVDYLQRSVNSLPLPCVHACVVSPPPLLNNISRRASSLILINKDSLKFSTPPPSLPLPLSSQIVHHNSPPSPSKKNIPPPLFFFFPHPHAYSAISHHSPPPPPLTLSRTEYLLSVTQCLSTPPPAPPLLPQVGCFFSPIRVTDVSHTLPSALPCSTTR